MQLTCFYQGARAADARPADPERATGHYARSKAMAERLALSAADDKLAVVAIRPHWVWGPGDTQLVGRIVERAEAGRLVLIDGGTALSPEHTTAIS